MPRPRGDRLVRALLAVSLVLTLLVPAGLAHEGHGRTERQGYLPGAFATCPGSPVDAGACFALDPTVLSVDLYLEELRPRRVAAIYQFVMPPGEAPLPEVGFCGHAGGLAVPAGATSLLVRVLTPDQVPPECDAGTVGSVHATFHE